MPWRIENGYPVRYSVHTAPAPPEVKQTEEFDEVLVCPECGRDYKTQAGLDNHIDDKH